ncbi:MAG: hypothetical protein IH942_07070 [Acidobacteria bacterium]|nr:hypothetical protein [Acidobacteriota bacterium]
MRLARAEEHRLVPQIDHLVSVEVEAQVVGPSFGLDLRVSAASIMLIQHVTFGAPTPTAV